MNTNRQLMSEMGSLVRLWLCLVVVVVERLFMWFDDRDRQRDRDKGQNNTETDKQTTSGK